MGGSPQITPLALIKRVWERIAPLQLAERSWDNVCFIPIFHTFLLTFFAGRAYHRSVAWPVFVNNINTDTEAQRPLIPILLIARCFLPLSRPALCLAVTVSNIHLV